MSTVFVLYSFLSLLHSFYSPNHSFLFIIKSEQPFHLLPRIGLSVLFNLSAVDFELFILLFFSYSRFSVVECGIDFFFLLFFLSASLPIPIPESHPILSFRLSNFLRLLLFLFS